MGELTAQITELLLGGADLGLKVPLAIVIGLQGRFRACSLIGGGKLSAQFSEGGGKRRFCGRCLLRGG